MIIDNSCIEMISYRSYKEELIKEESSTFWNGNPPEEILPQPDLPIPSEDSVEISTEASSKNKEFYFELSLKDKYKLTVLSSLLEAFTGKKIRFYLPCNQDVKSGQELQSIKTAPKQTDAKRAGWGMEYDYHETYHEAEQTTFKASGIVRTADGKEINISLGLNMSRSFSSERHLHIRAGDAALMDPLLINFDGPAAALTDYNIEFDLDFDGDTENISFLNPGSGFLALDLNDDGTINNGKELFGPQSGDGFIELAHYDEDANGWIDENDSIFDKLQIWSKDADGNDVLFGLADKNIGAICLNNVDTSFALKDSTNELKGQIRSSGIFLRENGTTGTVQQLDLKI